MNKEQILNEIRNSAFSRPNYNVDIHLRRFLQGLLVYTDPTHTDDGGDVNIDDVFKAVPDFQRKNDKWTQDMQITFIRNLIKGFRTEIRLYEVNKDGSRIQGMTHCKIIDGLQRVTAIHAFMKGQFRVFGLTYDEMIEERILNHMSVPITIRVYSFPSESEAIEFYIEMNENITHSSADIAKARVILNEINKQ